jgi:hypothetical protein
LKRIRDIQIVRNLVAHANGDLRFERDEPRKQQIHQLAKAGVGVSIREESVLVSERFLGDSLRGMEDFVNWVLNECERRYPRKRAR